MPRGPACLITITWHILPQPKLRFRIINSGHTKGVSKFLSCFFALNTCDHDRVVLETEKRISTFLAIMEGGEVGEVSVFSFFWDDENSLLVIAFQKEKKKKKSALNILQSHWANSAAIQTSTSTRRTFSFPYKVGISRKAKFVFFLTFLFPDYTRLDRMNYLWKFSEFCLLDWKW